MADKLSIRALLSKQYDFATKTGEIANLVEQGANRDHLEEIFEQTISDVNSIVSLTKILTDEDLNNLTILINDCTVYIVQNFNKDPSEILTYAKKVLDEISKLVSSIKERYQSDITVIALEIQLQQLIKGAKQELDELRIERQDFSSWVEKESHSLLRIHEVINEYKLQTEKTKLDVDFLKATAMRDSETINSVRENIEKEHEDFRIRNKDAIAKVELITQAATFLRSSSIARTELETWKNAIIALVTTLFVMIFVFIYNAPTEIDTIRASYNRSLKIDMFLAKNLLWYEIGKFILIKLLIISIIVFLIKFCVKIYNALRHTESINNHKANSFTAADKLITSLPQESSKEILNQATKEIFAQPQTGYLTKGSDEISIALVDKILSKK